MAKKSKDKVKKESPKQTPPKAKKKAVAQKDDKRQTKKTKPSKQAKPKTKRKPSRYNALQKILSAYGKSKGIKFGKTFNKKVNELALRTTHVKKEKGKIVETTYDPLKYIEQNIDAIYSEYLSVKDDVERNFDSSFQWFHYAERFLQFKFNTVLIRIYFKDDIAEEPFIYEGLANDVVSWWRTSGLYPHLRKYWSDSPEIARFNLEDTDNSTFVNYVCIMGEISLEELERRKIAEGKPDEALEKEKQKTIAELKAKMKNLLGRLKAGAESKKESEKKAEVSEKEKDAFTAETEKINKEIELEKVRQTTKDKEIELKSKEIELINKRLELMQQLKALGMSNEAIIEYLNKLG